MRTQSGIKQADYAKQLQIVCQSGRARIAEWRVANGIRYSLFATSYSPFADQIGSQVKISPERSSL